jgi:hypothetical protein
MSKSKDVHVVPRDGKWAAVRPGNDRASGVFPTQKQAVNEGRQIARNSNSELLIHGRNGQIRARDSYGNDPCPPKDQK